MGRGKVVNNLEQAGWVSVALPDEEEEDEEEKKTDQRLRSC